MQQPDTERLAAQLRNPNSLIRPFWTFDLCAPFLPQSQADLSQAPEPRLASRATSVCPRVDHLRDSWSP